jgi:hypothetical protein
MPTVKKLGFANGTVVTEPVDLSLEMKTKQLEYFADDAAYDALYDVVEGSIYLNTTLKAPRMYVGGAWRTGIVQQDPTDDTKTVNFDLTGCSAGADNLLDFNSTADRTYTFPDANGTIVLTLGAQELQDKTIKNGFLDGTKIRNGALDVEAAGGLKIAENIGPHVLQLGGASAAITIPGSLFVEGTATYINSQSLEVEDKNIIINKDGSDVSSEGAGFTVYRDGTDGSLIYKDSAPNKFAAGPLGSEKNLAAIDDISVTNLSGILPPSKGGTGVANNDAATITRVGNHPVTLTTTGETNVTLPTSGTLATTDQIIGSGVGGPAVSSVDAVALWNNTTGTLLKNSLVSVTSATVNAGEFKTISASLSGSTLSTTAANPDLLILPDAAGKILFKREPVSDGGSGLTLNNDTNTFKTQLLPGTLTANRQATMPNASGEVVLTTATQNLSAKTLVEPLVDNFQAFNHEATPAQASAGTIRVFAKSDNKLYTIDSTGLESQIGSGGTTDRVTQTGHGFDEGDVLYLNGSTYTKAIATSAAAAEVVGVVSKVVDINTFELTLSGEVTGLTGLTAGEVYFLSAATAGLLTTTEPTVIGQVSVPVGVASSATTLYVAPKRGSIVGGVNARTEVALTSGAVTNVQNVAGMTAGELAGWVFISSSPARRFYVSAKFALSGAGGDYNLSYQTTGDTPPVGFLVDITTTGMICVTLPASSGSTSVINYALNAPAIGASFPLTVSSNNVKFDKVVPETTSGISVRNAADSATNVFISDAGRVGIGTSSPTAPLTVEGEIRSTTSYIISGTGQIRKNLTNSALLDMTSSDAITFTTGVTPSERMRITTGGIELRNVSGITYIGLGGTGSANAVAFKWTSPNVIARIDNSVDVTLANVSDYRIKRDVETQSQPALERIAQLRPVTFKMADYGELFKSSEETHEGFLAHELQEIIPSSVIGQKDDPDQIQSLNLGSLCSVMVKAIQELKEELDAAKAEIAALKGV